MILSQKSKTRFCKNWQNTIINFLHSAEVLHCSHQIISCTKIQKVEIELRWRRSLFLFLLNCWGHLKTYTVISFHNLYTQPPQLIPLNLQNLYHFNISPSAYTTYTIRYNEPETQIMSILNSPNFLRFQG